MIRGGNRLRVNLLIHVHSAGLRRDVFIWNRALRRCGMHCTITAFNPQFHKRAMRALRKVAGRFSPTPPFDVNIFVENIVESWCSLARINVFVPNQEWVSDALRAKIPLMDYVFCKTRYAAQVFIALGSEVRYTGFSSVDRYNPKVQKDFNAFLHVAGSSVQKGTAAVNEVWLRHPEWPRLTMSCHEAATHVVPGSNISVITQFLKESALARTQNACGIHLCPSEAEGFGHYLVEAMSTGALVVTTDAPPMNELIMPGRGVLAAYNRTSPQGLGTNFYVDPADLERTIDGILGSDEGSRRLLGERARAWYHENDKAFVARLHDVLLAL
jgi:hypothetical protein